MSAFLARFWPYLAIGLALIVLWLIHEHDRARYSELQTDFANYKVQVATDNSTAQKAAREELQRQIDKAAKADTDNAKVIHDLEQQKVAIVADRDHVNDLVRRLLASAARSAASASHPVPETPDQPGTAGAGQASGDGQIASLLGDAATEFYGNVAQHDALIQQLKPQL
jgi:hypothetical protein